MNPDQPSREQIEARLTALLLGELPAAEAELLRWTISRDPELQKLHDQLKGTIGFVREAMHNPTGAPVGPETPLKLPEERRQNLLAHFKTARPQPPLIPIWRRQLKVSPLIGVLAVVAIIALLAAMLLPVLETAKSRGYRARITSSSQELDLGMQTTTSGRQTTKHAEKEPPTSQQNASIDNTRQITGTVNEWSLETGQASGSNSGEFSDAKITATSGRQTTMPAAAPEPPLARIALPNTGSSQTASEQYDTNVFSQNVVGYVNVVIPSNATTLAANQLDLAPAAPTVAMATPPPPSPVPEAQAQSGSVFVSPSDSGRTYATNFGELGAGNPSVPVVEVTPGGSAPSSNPESPQAQPNTASTAEMPSAPPQTISPQPVSIPPTTFAQIPPTPASGTTSFGQASKAEPPPQGGMAGSFSEKNNANVNNNLANMENGISAGELTPPVAIGGAGPISRYAWQANNVNLGPQTKSLSDNEKVENGISQSGLQNALAYATNGTPWSAQYFNFPDSPSSGYATNAVAINQPQNGNFDFYLGNQRSDQSALTTREIQNASTIGQTSSSLQGIAPIPLSPSPAGIAGSEPVARAGFPPRQEQIRVYHLKNANPSDVAAGLREMGLANSSGRGAEQSEQSPLANRESQNATTVSDNTMGLHNGPVTPAPESQAVARVPTLNDVPIVGSLFAGSGSRSQQNALAYQREEAQIQLDQSNVEQLRRQYNIHDADVTSSGPTPTLRSEQIQALNKKLVEQKARATKLEKEFGEFQANHGIMYGLRGQITATEAEVAALSNQLSSIEGEGQDESTARNPYWLAKAHLQDEEDLHKLLGEKIQADEADASMPKNAMVTIVNPAQPGQSQNLWQRMTGTVESQAQIEIQPDITSDAPILATPYDPYFLETEVNSIHSDAVLGKAVDALKLDQAWLKQGYDEELSRKNAIALLRSQLDLQTDRNSKLIDIGVKSDKPDEAAKIANAVAEAYQQYRLEVHSNEMESGIEKLKQKYAAEDKELHELRENVRQVKAPLSAVQADHPMIPAPQPSAPIPQPEIQTTDNAFSTFSMNVSDVSFKLAMASLQKGQMPDPASIRSEEFINAFDYHDPEPLQGEPLAFTFERAQDPFAQERDMLRFSIKAAAAGRQDGRALNIVLLLDTSGSMERADRVSIIREALNVLSGQLQPQDIVSVVTFARTARLWADGIPGNEAGATLDQVGSITPEGGTNLEEAMRLAYETALRHFIAGGINRVVLLTDGAANLGNVDPQALAQKVDSERRQGIALDCFGIGWDDYNDDLLEQLSSNGDGRYAFINSPEEAGTEFAAKLAGALQVAAEDVKVQVEFNPDRVTAWRQIGYAKHQLTKQQFRDNTVAAGAIASREAGNALYVIETNPNGQGPIATVRVRYRVPGTQDNYEKSWLVDYTGDAPELAQSTPAMRLAVTAAEISEWMANSPFAQDVTPDDLLNDLSGVPQFYGNDDRPKQLEWMIREAKSVSGK